MREKKECKNIISNFIYAFNKDQSFEFQIFQFLPMPTMWSTIFYAPKNIVKLLFKFCFYKKICLNQLKDHQHSRASVIENCGIGFEFQHTITDKITHV